MQVASLSARDRRYLGRRRSWSPRAARARATGDPGPGHRGPGTAAPATALRPPRPRPPRRRRASTIVVHPEADQQPVLRRRLQGRPEGRQPSSAAPSPRSGPSTADATEQIPFIQNATTQGVSAIVDLRRRRERDRPGPQGRHGQAGIKVVGYDSSPAVGAYNVFVNQADFGRHRQGPRRHGLRPRPQTAPARSRSCRRPQTATNQNAWIDAMKTTLDGPQVRGPQARRRRLRQRRPADEHRRRPRACSRRTRTSRSSSPRPPSASSPPRRSSRRQGKTGHGVRHRPRHSRRA